MAQEESMWVHHKLNTNARKDELYVHFWTDSCEEVLNYVTNNIGKQFLVHTNLKGMFNYNKYEDTYYLKLDYIDPTVTIHGIGYPLPTICSYQHPHISIISGLKMTDEVWGAWERLKKAVEDKLWVIEFERYEKSQYTTHNDKLIKIINDFLVDIRHHHFHTLLQKRRKSVRRNSKKKCKRGRKGSSKGKKRRTKTNKKK